MNAKRILYPTDFSPINDEALAYAASLAQGCGAELLIMHACEHPSAYVIGDSIAYRPAADVLDRVKRHLASAVPSAASVRFRHVLRTGVAADEIVQLAKEEDVDLIVMATHGRSGLTHLLMGSVAEAVIRRAPCPVLACRPQTCSPIAGAAVT